MMIKKIRKAIFGTATAALALSPMAASAADTQPGDFIAAPPGTNGILLYGIYGNNDGATIGGVDLPASLESYVIMPRYVYFFEVGGMTADINVLLPMGKLSNGSLGGADLGSADGFGDLTVAATLWLVNNPASNRYMGVAGYLNFPTGSYDPDDALNLGSNRVSGTLQLGGVYGLSEKWYLDLVGDVTLYGDNRNANGAGGILSQDPTYTVQSWINYQSTDKLRLSLGYGGYWGGDQSLDDVANGITSEKQQVRAAATISITPTLQLLGQINHDFDVKGGFKQDVSALFRIMKVF